MVDSLAEMFPLREALQLTWNPHAFGDGAQKDEQDGKNQVGPFGFGASHPSHPQQPLVELRPHVVLGQQCLRAALLMG